MRKNSQETGESDIRYDSNGRIDLAWLEARIAAREAARAKQQKHETYFRIAVAALSIVGTAKLYSSVRSSAETRRAAIDDEAIRSKERTATELKLGRIASDVSGQSDLAVICDADLSVFDIKVDKGFSYIVRGVYLDASQTKSGKSSILLDSTYCEIIEYSPYFEQKEQEQDAVDLLAGAVFSFAHEVGHATGISDEGDTNCIAVDLFPVVVDKLGIASAMADFDPLVLAKSIGSAAYHDAGC